MKIDILSGLTPAQAQAVTHVDGPMLVLAGPGSGKTRVIIHRIAYLIEQGIPAENILALTFTNKAAQEMRSRLALWDIPRGTTICTFHSLCARLLRDFADRVGLPHNFSIFARADQKSAVREAMLSIGLEPTQFPPARLLTLISSYKNGIRPSFTSDRRTSWALNEDEFELVYRSYQQQLQSNSALDFDDLLQKTSSLLRTDNELRDQLNQRYRYILVDEYQDTNTCQYRIVQELSRQHQNLFVTGDPDQSIYGWRGADITNIMVFEKDHPQAEVVLLEANFRSSPQILYLADNLIRENLQRKQKKLIASKAAGPIPRLYEHYNEFEEARGAVEWIRQMCREQGLDFSQIALFYRTNAMSRVLEDALRRDAIPYQIIKGLEFYNRKEIKDMLSYLRLLVNPSDRIALLRIINRPARGIGDTTVSHLKNFSEASGRDLWYVLDSPEEVSTLNKQAAARVKKFAELIHDLQTMPGESVAQLVKTVYEKSGLSAALQADKNIEAQENIDELINSAFQFDSEHVQPQLSEYLQQTALTSDTDGYENKTGAVSLMTLHSAKGLEFPAVMIIGIEEGIIPHVRSRGDQKGIEEERRLLFVGITRAEDNLALCYARNRTVNGTARAAGCSPFLDGNPGLETVSFAPITARYGAGQPSGQDGSSPEIPGFHFKTGQSVRHPSLGKGCIEKIMPEGDNPRVIVNFDSGVRLTLALKHARLETV